MGKKIIITALLGVGLFLLGFGLGRQSLADTTSPVESESKRKTHRKKVNLTSQHSLFSGYSSRDFKKITDCLLYTSDAADD